MKRDTKNILKSVGAVFVALMFLAMIILSFALRIDMCMSDGYNMTQCMMMLNGSGVVVAGTK